MTPGVTPSCPSWIKLIVVTYEKGPLPTWVANIGSGVPIAWILCNPANWGFNAVPWSTLTLAFFPVSKFWVKFIRDTLSSEGFEILKLESHK